ncbi:MAG TPA: glycosyltransferase family 2 protein [Candidatus Acidoferrales bacterium]|nr:glycosyltransferase family 2 protein [Candidatus Acidoferrales bacterium]
MESGSPAKFAVEPEIGTNPILPGALNSPPIENAGIFLHEIAQEEARDHWDWILTGVIVLGFALLVYEVYHYAAFDPLLAAAEEHRWARFIVRPTMLWTIMGTVLLGFRTIFWLRYRPFPSASFENAPRITVIIPAYNEGEMVMKSIASVALAAYPAERLEILVIDDGSTDDTWIYIERAAARFAGRVTPIRFAKNRGKREALAEGFVKASGEIVVTIDSDSAIESRALLAIAGPFRDPRIGAVAGKVAVYNRRHGLIPRMLHVRYILSFDLLRAVESSYRTVYCCPGALTGYRTSVVRGVLERWSAQTFWGVPCTYGEDRALTNFILEAGFHTVYQRSAVVHTIAPETYGKLCKMFLRWDRSYIREEIRFQSIVWKRPLVPRCIALCDRLITNLRYPVNYAALFLLIYLAFGKPFMVLRLLTVIGIMSFFNMLYFLRSERSMDFLYGILYAYFGFFTLFWIFPYAFFTLRSRSWLTR